MLANMFRVVVALLTIALFWKRSTAQSLSVFSNCVSPLAAYTSSVPNYATIIGQSLITRGRPGSIVVVNNVNEVARTIKCARKSKLKVCARSGVSSRMTVFVSKQCI